MNNFRNLPTFRSDFKTSLDELFNDFFNDISSEFDPFKPVTRTGYPKFNIFDNGNELTIEASVPGLEKDNISLEFDEQKGLLKIHGENVNKKEKKDEKVYHCRELKKTGFTRSIALSKKLLNLSNINAKVEKGILTIKIPIKKEGEQVSHKRRIQIE